MGRGGRRRRCTGWAGEGSALILEVNFQCLLILIPELGIHASFS